MSISKIYDYVTIQLFFTRESMIANEHEKKIKMEGKPAETTQEFGNKIDDVLDEHWLEVEGDKKIAAKKENEKQKDEENKEDKNEAVEQKEDAVLEEPKSDTDIYLDTIEEREFCVKIVDHDPLEEPVAGYTRHYFDPQFLEPYTAQILRTLKLWREKKLELLNEFMGKTNYPEFADQSQRDFITDVELVEESLKGLKFPIGLIDKRYLSNYLKAPGVHVDDEMVDFFYHAIKARKFCFKFYIDEAKYNYELSTIWPNTGNKEHSYGKSEVEDLSYLLMDDDMCISQPMLNK